MSQVTTHLMILSHSSTRVNTGKKLTKPRFRSFLRYASPSLVQRGSAFPVKNKYISRLWTTVIIIIILLQLYTRNVINRAVKQRRRRHPRTTNTCAFSHFTSCGLNDFCRRLWRGWLSRETVVSSTTKRWRVLRLDNSRVLVTPWS